MTKHTKKTVLLVLVTAILLVPLATYALSPIVPDCAREKAKTTTPPVECIVLTFINVAKLILGISGSVALALFIYGGFLMVISGGNDQMVAKGKSVLSGALIGIIIVFGAYTGIFFLTKTLVGDSCIEASGSFKPDGEGCGRGGTCQSGVCLGDKTSEASAPQETSCAEVSTDAQGGCVKSCISMPTDGQCPASQPSTLNGPCSSAGRLCQ